MSESIYVNNLNLWISDQVAPQFFRPIPWQLVSSSCVLLRRCNIEDISSQALPSLLISHYFLLLWASWLISSSTTCYVMF
jgi:hypothetical protein